MAVVQEKETGAVIAYGDEAVKMLGKLPATRQFVRPYWADQIIDRDVLRGILEVAVHLDQQALPTNWVNSLWQRGQYRMVLPPTVSELHRQWLRRTWREVGLWRWQEEDGFWNALMPLVRRSHQKLVIGVVDLGFSAARAAVYTGSDVLLAEKRSDLSLSAFCDQLVNQERRESQILFSDSSLYDQQWFTQQVGFHEQEQRPVARPLQKKSVQLTQQAFQEAVGSWLAEVNQKLPTETAAQLKTFGWVVTGGFTAQPEWVEQWAQQLEVPVQLHPQAKYAEIRSTTTS